MTVSPYASEDVVAHEDGHLGPEYRYAVLQPRSLELRARRTLWQRVTGRAPGVLPVMLLARSNYFSVLWRSAESRARGEHADARVYAEQLEYAMGALATVASLARGARAGDPRRPSPEERPVLVPEELLEYVASTAERARRHVLNIAVARESERDGKRVRL